MAQLKNYYFNLFHHDVEPIVKGNSIWSLQSEYVIDYEHFGYTNWISEDDVLQTVVPNGEDVAMHIITDNTVALDTDVVAHSVEIGEAATLNVTDDHSMRIGDSLVLNGLLSVTNSRSLSNASAETALQMTGTGTINLSANGYSGYLGTQENRNAFVIGKDLTVTTFGWSSGYIYANIANAGTITTEAGELSLKGNTIENTGAIVTGGRNIYLEDATVNGAGVLNGVNGDIQLYGVTVNNGALTGTVKINGDNPSTLNQITVDENGVLSIQAHTIAQGSLAIEGKVNVWNNRSLTNASTEAALQLTGTGTMNLSDNGYSGSLGTEAVRNAFVIGKDLTVTTNGWSSGYIYANLTNSGIITTQAGELTLKGNTIENAGMIVTGGRNIYLEDATVNGGALNGTNGEIQLYGVTVNNGALTGTVKVNGDNPSTLNQITVDENGELSIQAHAIAQGSLGIEGKVNVWNNRSLTNASAEAAVALTGTGTLNLSANGYSGYLGTKENRNTFVIGKDLTVTTHGWSPGYIHADLTNHGIITTQAGELTLKGNTIENAGTIVTGGRNIYLEDATVNGGALNGTNGDIQLYGATMNNGVLTGTVKVNGETASTLNQITVDENGELSIQAHAIAQGSLGIEGKVNVWNNRSLTNASAEAAVALTGTGTLNLSANGYSGYLGTKENRNTFVIGKDLTVTTHGWSPGARSLAVYVDELIGFIKCFNKYRGGNDEQVWTQLYNGGSVIVNRVSSQPLNIEDTCIGVIGTIQPGLLNEFAKGKTESGFVDRWLFAYPDDTAYPKLNDAQLPKERTKQWCDIIDRIYSVPFTPGAKPIKLTRDAMEAYSNWFNALADQKNNSSNAFAEMATKMERYCVRFAIVLEALSAACKEKQMKSISLASLKGGIALCYYFIACALKARKKFTANPLEDLTEKQRKIYNELPISFQTSEAVDAALDAGMSERAMKEWLKSRFFKHVSHGQYEKRFK